MKKSFRQFLKDEKDDWLDFFETIGLKTTAQQFAVGIAIGVIILMIIGCAEYVHDLITGGV